MANKVGPLIKQARTGAGLTQEQLSKQVDGLTAADISKAERGEKELTQSQLRQIAKITGVTQASLLNAAKEGSAAKPAASAKKPTASSKPAASAKKPTASSKPAASAKKPTTSSKPATSAKKPAAAAKKEEEIKLTAAEKKLLELYRAADKDTREAAVKVLKGEKLEGGLLSLLSGGGGGLLDGAMDLLGLGKK